LLQSDEFPVAIAEVISENENDSGLLHLDGLQEFFHGAFDDVFFIDDDISFALCLLSDAAGIAETNGSCDKERNGSLDGLHRSVLARCGLNKQEQRGIDRGVGVMNAEIVAYG